MNKIPLLTWPDLPPWLASASSAAHPGYYAMYSSAWGGIVTDPRLMLVPFDDHLVHRGDGVFETIKCERGALYLLPEHLQRLQHSAAEIGLVSPWDGAALTRCVLATVRAGGRDEALVRLILSRGPGSLGVNPYDCPRPGLYVLVHELKPSFMTLHPQGARVRTSAVPVKPGFLATTKTCNYLPNALMKKEAVDAGVDFTVSLDERGHLAEGATENLGVVTREGDLLVPRGDRILAGTTMRRVLDLAGDLIGQGLLRRAGTADLRPPDLATAAEVLIFGTTPDVTSVVEYDGRPVGDGTPGRVGRALLALLRQDIEGNPQRRTPIR